MESVLYLNIECVFTTIQTLYNCMVNAITDPQLKKQIPFKIDQTS